MNCQLLSKLIEAYLRKQQVDLVDCGHSINSTQETSTRQTETFLLETGYVMVKLL